MAEASHCSGFQVLQIDERAEPTTAGRADGIQPRTIEVSEIAVFFFGLLFQQIFTQMVLPPSSLKSER